MASWNEHQRAEAQTPGFCEKPSANGYLLGVNGYQLHATWAAPWFVLALDDPEAEGYDPEPWLIHCESLAHARSCRGNFWRTILLSHDFAEVPWLTSTPQEP